MRRLDEAGGSLAGRQMACSLCHLEYDGDLTVLTGRAVDSQQRCCNGYVAGCARRRRRGSSGSVSGGVFSPGDRLTVAGPVDPERRHYVVETHSGVALAPLLGRLVRYELEDGNTEGMLKPFRPAWFANSEWTSAPARMVRTMGEQ